MVRLAPHIRQHRTWDIALIVVIALAATSGWLNLDLPKGHDAVADMLSARAASTSIFTYHTLSGWSTDWFMGHVQFSVHSPLAALLVLLPGLVFGWVLGTKLLFLSFFALSGVFACLYVRELTASRPAAIVAGLAYVFAPYHIIDVGFEGHQGSFSTPYMLLPLALLLLERLTKAPGLKYVLLNGMVLALLTLTFPQVLPLLAGPFLVLYVIVRTWWERGRGGAYVRTAVAATAGSFCLALLLSSFWWLPLISDIRYSFATSFTVEDTSYYTASFWQAVTLRPSLCCATSSAFGSAGSALLEALRLVPFVLVLAGLVLNRRNGYAWFFSACVFVSILLAMGDQSPVDLYGVAHRFVPLFDRLRTPVRFLFFPCIACAVLTGLFVRVATERLGRIRVPKLRSAAVPLLIPALAGLIVAGNTWQETRTAFSTYTLQGDVAAAMDWVAEQEDGDYRVADPPFDAYTHDSQAGEMIRPVFWTYLHGKETLYGPGLSSAVKYTAAVLESFNARLAEGPLDLSGWLSYFNVKYVLIDKSHPLSPNVILDGRFDRAWTSDTIDIYENQAMLPRLFALTLSDERSVALWDGDRVAVSPAEDSVSLSLDTALARSSDRTLKADFTFADPGPESAGLAVDLRTVGLTAQDAICLDVYSDRGLPDISLRLDLIEDDGSRYSLVTFVADGIQAGWNQISAPLSLFTLMDSTDENGRLDPVQLQTLAFGPSERSRFETERTISLHFDRLSVAAQEIDTGIAYDQLRPGQYRLTVSVDSPSWLVLSESYHPRWAARVDGESTPSQPMYECLNAFRLEPGEHQVTLDFHSSPSRTAAGSISGAAWVLVCCTGVWLIVRGRRRKGGGSLCIPAC